MVGVVATAAAAATVSRADAEGVGEAAAAARWPPLRFFAPLGCVEALEVAVLAAEDGYVEEGAVAVEFDPRAVELDARHAP